jgi:hypothetical protein
MDGRVFIGIIATLVELWAALLVLFWALRPKGVPDREIMAVVPDVLLLVRSIIGDRTAPLSPSGSAIRTIDVPSTPAAKLKVAAGVSAADIGEPGFQVPAFSPRATPGCTRSNL